MIKKFTIWLICLFIVLFVVSFASAELKTFIKEYTYQASEADSKLSSRVIALEQVKRLLLEEIGTYLESHTEVVNFQLTKDQITSLTAGIVQTQIIKEKWDGERYWMQAKIEADPDKVVKDVDSLRKDYQKSKELTDNRRKADELSIEVERLKRELAIVKTDQNKIARYNKAVRELSATDWVERGVEFYMSGKFGEAINAMTRAIQLDPQDERAHRWIANAYSMSGQYHQAIEELNKLIEKDPDDVFRFIEYESRGDSYYGIENYKQAISDYTKSIGLNPSNETSYVKRGRSYLKLGDYQKAHWDLNRIMKVIGRNENAIGFRSVVYFEMGEYDKSLDDCNRILQINPKNSLAYRLRGNIYGKLKKYEQAIKDIDDAIGLDSRNPVNYNSKGMIYQDMGLFSEALNNYNIGLSLNPVDKNICYNIACLYSIQNEADKACEWLRKAIKYGYNNFNHLINDRDFDNIRNKPCFKELVVK